MWSLVLLVFLNSLEIPLYCLFIPPHQLQIDAYVVVAGGVLRGYLAGLLVPNYCLLVHLFGTSINDSNLIVGTGILRMLLCHLYQHLDLLVSRPLVSGQDKKSYSIIRVYLLNFVACFLGFDFQDPLVFINIGYALQRPHPFWFHLVYASVVIKSLFENSFIIENVGIAHDKGVVLGVIIYHISVPLYTLFHAPLVTLHSTVA